MSELPDPIGTLSTDWMTDLVDSVPHLSNRECFEHGLHEPLLEWLPMEEMTKQVSSGENYRFLVEPIPTRGWMSKLLLHGVLIAVAHYRHHVLTSPLYEYDERHHVVVLNHAGRKLLYRVEAYCSFREEFLLGWPD